MKTLLKRKLKKYETIECDGVEVTVVGMHEGRAFVHIRAPEEKKINFNQDRYDELCQSAPETKGEDRAKKIIKGYFNS